PRDAYRDLFDDAGARIAAALAGLRTKGFAKIAIVSHSMGASMADAFFARGGAAAAWVPVGMLVDFTAASRAPVLDVVAEGDFPEVLASAKLRALRLRRDGCSRSVTFPATHHYLNGATQPLR